jgi:DNA-binding protein YbaB
MKKNSSMVLAFCLFTALLNSSVSNAQNVYINNSPPVLTFYNPSSGTNLKHWDFYTTGNSLLARTVNDVNNAANTWLAVNRSEFTPTTISFPLGNVGIGTPNPGIKLDVQGDIGKYDPYEAKIQGLRIGANPVYGASGARELSLVNKVSALRNGNGGNAEQYLIRSDGFDTYLAQGAGNLLYQGTGNFGIGTLSPDEKLTVNGKIHAKEVRIDTSIPTPDYVFNKDYSLMSLTDVKNYIDKNHHLPEVPSAADVEKNGLKLGEMNLILLKKVEELTLHLIEKDKQMEEMQNQFKDLKNNNECQQSLIEQQTAKITALENLFIKKSK